MTALKYAVLILPRRSANEVRELTLGDGIVSFAGCLPDLVDPTQVEFWERSVGELRWRGIAKKARHVVVTTPARQPGVLDAENQRLMNSLRPVVAAMNLTRGPGRPWGEFYMLTGDADGPRAFRDIRSYEDFPERHRPFYERRDEYVDSFDWSKDPWLDEWAEVCALVGQGPWVPLLAYGLQSLAHAIAEPELEFRIPELVRCAETVLALRKGLGARDFAERALMVASELRTAKFTEGVDLLKLLCELYELRNACVHGKLPFEELAAQGDAGALRVAQLEYAAEEVARASLLLALRRPGPHFVTRAKLEEAWTTDIFSAAETSRSP